MDEYGNLNDQELLDDCEAYLCNLSFSALTDWETEFLESLHETLEKFHKLTPRQRAKLEEINEKLSEADLFDYRLHKDD